MAKSGPKTDGTEPRGPITIRLSPSEQGMLDRVAHERGDKYAADAIRALPLVWIERMTLLRAALEPMQGRYTDGEISLILDVMNGTYLLAGLNLEAGLPDASMIGQHVAANIADSPEYGEKWEVADVAALAQRIHAEPRATKIALELWCGWLWSRPGDDALWAKERAWLETGKTSR